MSQKRVSRASTSTPTPEGSRATRAASPTSPARTSHLQENEATSDPIMGMLQQMMQQNKASAEQMN